MKSVVPTQDGWILDPRPVIVGGAAHRIFLTIEKKNGYLKPAQAHQKSRGLLAAWLWLFKFQAAFVALMTRNVPSIDAGSESSDC